MISPAGEKMRIPTQFGVSLGLGLMVRAWG